MAKKALRLDEIGYWSEVKPDIVKKKTGRKLDGRTWDEMPDRPRRSWTLHPIEQQA